jgi:hypothetical protein
VQTAVQSMKCIHQLAMRSGGEDWDAICKLAAIGMPSGYVAAAKLQAESVREWSGSAKAYVLAGIERFEITMKVKPQLAPWDLLGLARIKLPEAPRFVPAMVKAMLADPARYQSNGINSLVDIIEFHSVNPAAELRTHAISAHDIMY